MCIEGSVWDLVLRKRVIFCLCVLCGRDYY